VTTELTLRRLGMKFFYEAGKPTYSGQANHAATMRAEIDRREKLFREARAVAKPGAIVKIATAPVPRFGHCMTCGDEIEPHRSGMCYLCISAWRRVVL